MVVRGNLTGHAWRTYSSGKRQLCGVAMPDGFDPEDFVAGRKAGPGDELLDRRPARHVGANLREDLQDGMGIEPIDAREIDTDEAKAFWLPAGDARYIDLTAPLARPALPITKPPEWLISLDRIADPILAKPAGAAG